MLCSLSRPRVTLARCASIAGLVNTVLPTRRLLGQRFRMRVVMHAMLFWSSLHLSWNVVGLSWSACTSSTAQYVLQCGHGYCFPAHPTAPAVAKYVLATMRCILSGWIKGALGVAVGNCGHNVGPVLCNRQQYHSRLKARLVRPHEASNLSRTVDDHMHAPVGPLCPMWP